MNALRNPRIVVAPSKRIHNWSSLPVEGTGSYRAQLRLERACHIGIVGFAIVTTYLCAAHGWQW